MVPNNLAIAWASGLFEGEGCISHSTKNLPRLYIGMTDKDIIERFVKIVDCGKITIRTRKDPKHKPQWIWQIQKASEVNRILTMFLPYLGQRRAYKALNALDILDHIY
jgi:hypothetical protein